MSKRFGFEWGAATDPGVRAENQDAYLADHPVYLVADGMGGHRDGRAAADAVVTACRAVVGPHTVPLAELGDAVVRGAEAVTAMGAGPEAPGTTVSGVALVERDGVTHWCVFNVGDSRGYLLRGGILDQVTRDHSLAQEAADAALAEGRPPVPVARNIITRAFGGGASEVPEIDRWMIPVRMGDVFFLCTDGVSGVLPRRELESELSADVDPAVRARSIVARAVAAGSRDNCTAVVVRAGA